MKYSTILLGLLLSGSALAAELPISSIYGSELTCELYAQGGTNAVVSSGGSIGWDWAKFSGDTSEDSYVLVSPTEVLGAEWGCRPDTVNGETVTMSCSGEGEEFPATATIHVDADTGTLHYKDTANIGAVELHPCPAEPATM